MGSGEGARSGEGGGQEGGGKGELQEEGPDDAAGELSSNVPHAAVVAEPAGDAEGERHGRVHCGAQSTCVSGQKKFSSF